MGVLELEFSNSINFHYNTYLQLSCTHALAGCSLPNNSFLTNNLIK